MLRDQEKRAYETRLYVLLERQRELDELILSQIEPIIPAELTANRLLAFVVEIGECANEVRSFKHWSKKGPSKRSVILEEYVDALHFLLSLTYSLREAYGLWEYDDGKQVFDCSHRSAIYEREMAELPVYADNDMRRANITQHFLGVYREASGLEFQCLMADMVDPVPEDISAALSRTWDAFTDLGAVLGFTDHEIDEAYAKKYEENIKRQKEGY